MSVAIILATGLVASWGGCNTPSGPTPTPDPSTLAGITTPFSHIRLSGDQLFTVVYSASAAATDVSAYYVAVESTALDAPAIGPEITFATGLPSGDNKTVTLATGAIPLGLYRVGLLLANTTISTKILSQGTFEVTDLPEPEFTLPNQSRTVQPGTAIEVQATVGDAENAVQWRLFYLEATSSTAGVPTDQLGTEIAVGTSNEVSVIWGTSAVPFGTYRIGVSVTDTGQSIAQTVAAGEEDRIITTFNDFTIVFAEEEPPARPPAIVVSQPGTNQNILASDTVLVQFSVTVFEGPPAAQSVTVFYDFDGVADTGDEVPFAEDLPITATSAVFSGSLIDPGQTVRLGVTADDGKNDPVSRYANGAITRITAGDATLTVTQPNSPLPKKPGEQVSVAWQLSGLPTTANAEVDVFYQRVDDEGDPVGAITAILAPSPLTVTTASFSPTSSGRFRVTVRITFADASTAPLIKTAPALVVVSTLPGIFWLGDLGVAGSPVQGAIFEGVQFEDNAGSAFAGDADFDDDGLNEFFIVSRYGKPEFVNPSGVGAGEAYMIRGRSDRFENRFNLNSVGTSLIPGFVFTGIEPDPTTPTPDTDGITSIFISQDADDDGIGEIIFGFPHVRSIRSSILDGPNIDCPMTGVTDPQFARGGVVIVSSANTELQFPDTDTGARRCPLGRVGQTFDSRTLGADQISPEPGQGALCSASSSWMRDLLTFVAGPCPPAAGPNEASCVAGADSERETLVEPRFGFDERLASPYPCDNGIPCRAGELVEGCPMSDPGGGADCDEDQIDPADPLCEQVSPLVDVLTAEMTCAEQNEAAGARLRQAWIEPIMFGLRGFPVPPAGTFGFLSGYYRERLTGAADWNTIVPSLSPKITSLVGCRIIGEEVDDAFGTSITQSRDDLIITAPFSSEGHPNGGIAYMVEDYIPIGIGLPRLWHNPALYRTGGPDSYNRTPPPIPHQYLAGGNSHFGVQLGARATRYQDTGGLRLIGDEDEQIENVTGIPDFNIDGIEDIAVGAPLADVDADGTADGAVYIVYRRAETLEGEYSLANLKIAPTQPERLSGLLIREVLGGQQRFGQSVAGGIDINHDGIEDVVVGNPDGNAGTGEIIIIFGDFDVTSPQNGIAVDDEAGAPGLLSRLAGARIRGVELGSEFGSIVANIGDVDGDGRNDLAVAAPNATPRFDGDPSDATDQLNTLGLDRNLDGIKDDVSGPLGRVDGKIDVNDSLVQAGLVYIILSSTDTANFDTPTTSVMDVAVSALGSAVLDGYIIVGRRGQRFDLAGTMVHEGDFLGGGDAGQVAPVILHGVTLHYGGTASKAPAGGRQRGHSIPIGRAGDLDGDGVDDLLLGAPLADPRVDPSTGRGTKNGGEAYLIYGFRP